MFGGGVPEKKEKRGKGKKEGGRGEGKKEGGGGEKHDKDDRGMATSRFSRSANLLDL